MSQHEDASSLPDHDVPGSWDDALCRLEDVLLGAPFDRALPDLDALLDRARVTIGWVRADDRALKLLHEAVLARPLGEVEEVRRSRAHVEMMTLEVEVLTGRLADPDTPPDVARDALGRLHELDEQLSRLRDEL